MNLFLCKFELKEERFQDDIRMYLDSGARLSTIDCAVLSTMMQISGEVLEELDLTKSYTPFIGTEKLIQQMKNCKKCFLSRLSCCGITEEGCVSVASALKSNPSHLRELDLSYNHPGGSGVKLLLERLEDPECRLETLKSVHCVDSTLTDFIPFLHRILILTIKNKIMNYRARTA
uniref:SPRY-associated domain-containing protein n=1 Tax=Pundamilia nyererei TaxID=303518 RepID=A0A3B4FH23_9CICH